MSETNEFPISNQIRSPRRHSNRSKTFKKIGKIEVEMILVESFKTMNRTDLTQPDRDAV